MSSTTVANPDCTPTANNYYILTVTDADTNTSEAGVGVDLHYLDLVNAGDPPTLCFEDTTTIGGAENITGQDITYSWLPAAGLSDSTAPRPLAAPTETTTYTLTATTAACSPKIEIITVTVIPPPLIDAGDSITIKEGEIAILNAIGGTNYSWSPDSVLRYPFTANPDAEPIITSTYYLLGYDLTGKCPAIDSVTVTVTPYDEIDLYNTFTPNDDVENDTWHIGNIEKYPDNEVVIYNRNGKIVYQTTGYTNAWDGNSWDGKSFGANLPAATYYFTLDLKKGGRKYNGTITIIK